MLNTTTDLSLATERNYRNNPFGRVPRRTRENGAAYNTDFGKAVFRTSRDSTSRRFNDPTVRFIDLDYADLIHAPTNTTHYGNDFVKNF
jgi:hypothetical protein